MGGNLGVVVVVVCEIHLLRLLGSGPLFVIISRLYLNRTERVRARIFPPPPEGIVQSNRFSRSEVSGNTNMEREGGGRKKNKGKFAGTHVVIGGFEMNRCEAVSGDEVIF